MASTHRGSRPRRTGVAASECAVILPVLLLIMAGTIEICTTLFLRESLRVAAYEGARVAVQRRATNDDVERKVAGVLSERSIVLDGLSSDPVTISTDVATAPIFTPITVTVRAPTAGNTVVPFALISWIAGRETEAQVVMRKEFSDVLP